jgi:F-type H+-transporting ATPase subunit a
VSEGHHSPLAQFEIKPLVPFEIGGVNLSFTNSSLWMILAILAITALLLPAARKQALVPGRLQGTAEMLHEFVTNMISEVAGREGLKYFPFIFTLFMFVLLSNLLGMIPVVSFTTTSHIAVTFSLAVFIFLAVTMIAIFKHGLIKFLHFFVPEGTPFVMIPLLFFIELFSYLARPVSLSIRLAANMMAGHVTMKVIAGLIITFGLIGVGTMFPLLIFLTGFEIAIAIIQAYIFTILTCVYLNDALHLH